MRVWKSWIIADWFCICWKDLLCGEWNYKMKSVCMFELSKWLSSWIKLNNLIYHLLVTIVGFQWTILNEWKLLHYALWWGKPTRLHEHSGIEKKKYVPKIPYMGIQLLAYDVWLRHLYSRQKELFKIRQTKSRYFGGIFKDHSWFQKRLKRPVKMILNIIGNQL